MVSILEEKVESLQTLDAQYSCSKTCADNYRIMHAVMLLLDQVDSNQQKVILEKLQMEPFEHMIRFNCWTVKTDVKLQIHKLLIRKMYQITKKKKEFRQLFRNGLFLNYVLLLIVDSTKRTDLMKQLYLAGIQKEAIMLFVKYLKMKNEFKLTQIVDNVEIGDDGNNTSSEEKLIETGFDVEDENGKQSSDEEESDKDLMQKILNENLSEKFNSENMFSPENIKQTVRLLRKMAKQLHKNNFLKGESLDVDIVL